MKNKALKFFIGLLFCCFFVAKAQKQGKARIDSLEVSLAKQAVNDTNMVNTLCDLSYTYYAVNPEAGIKAGKQALEIATKLNFKPGIAKAYRYIGANYHGTSDYTLALKFYQKAFELEKALGNKKGMGSIYVNLGLVYTNQSSYSISLEYYFKALKLFEEIDFQKGIAHCYGNIVLVYMETENYDKAEEFALKALALDKELQNASGEARHLGNLGLIYTYKLNFKKAHDYYNLALKSYQSHEDTRGVANVYGNIGACFAKQKKYEKAIEYINQSLTLYQELASTKDVATNLINLGDIYLEQHSVTGNAQLLRQALDLQQKARLMGIQIGDKMIERDAEKMIYKIYKTTKDEKMALMHYEIYTSLRDSINGQENKKDIFRKELQFQYEKKATADSIKNASENELQKLQIEAQKSKLDAQAVKQYALIFGLILMISFALIIAQRLRLTNRQKAIIEQQKNAVEVQRFNVIAQKKIVDEKNREILDSIVYAKRLQEAILPSNKLLTKYLPNSYVFYQPKDIVAGDFYWMEIFSKADEIEPIKMPEGYQGAPEDYILFAVADCTGHGVPGAMVSIFCSNALNRSVKEFGLIDPGKILDKVRYLVIETFEKSEMEVKDGMDISLCSFNFKTNELYWAGANNPLWLVRNNQMIQYKPDKQPIGKYDNPKPFNTERIQLEKGDKFYIFTDGLADQFGGEKGKKLKTGKMRELIMSQQSNSMQMQYSIMANVFEMWKGDLEQVDDICVIGVSL